MDIDDIIGERYTFSKMENKLTFLCRNKCHLTQKSELGKYKPTHVVTAITYGGNAHIEFRKVNKIKKIICYFPL